MKEPSGVEPDPLELKSTKLKIELITVKNNGAIAGIGHRNQRGSKVARYSPDSFPGLRLLAENAYFFEPQGYRLGAASAEPGNTGKL